MDQQIAKAAKEYAREAHEEELELLRRLAKIPAPSGKEGKRAAFVKEWLKEAGADGVFIDPAGNVICRLEGKDRNTASVFSAHMDVVAKDEETLPLREDTARLYAPGVGDDTANLTGLLMATKWILARRPPLKHDVWVVANTCEEGLGNLAGTRRLIVDLREAGLEVADFTAFDLYLGQHITRAVGSHRWRVEVETQGGHSWEDAGRQSAVESVCRVVEGLYAIPLPDEGKTTVNVGAIEGGGAVNAIASRASALLEYRSASQENLEYMDRKFKEIVESARAEDADVEVKLIGDRPASLASRPEGQSDLVDLGDEAIRALGGVEPTHQESSTDANIPLSLGVPAHTVGAVSGALLHTREEWIDKHSLEPGLALVLGLMLSTCAEAGQAVS